MFNVDAKLFEIASRFISTEATRYYLNGVSIEPCDAGGVTIVATDGHRMFVAYDESGAAARSLIVRLDKDILRACKKADHVATGYDGDGEAPSMATVYDDEGNPLSSGRVSFIDGNFPHWRGVVPDSPGADFAPVNSRYVQDFAKAADDMGKARGMRQGASVSISGTSDKGAACVISFGGDVPAFGLLMPVISSERTGHCGRALMDRINAAPRAVAAE